MTEEWLISEGFEKTVVPHSESGNGYDYYFYSKEICDDISLYTTDSDQVTNNDWTIKCWQIPSLMIKSLEHYYKFIDLLNVLICE